MLCLVTKSYKNKMYKTQVFPQQPEIIACHVTKVLRIIKTTQNNWQRGYDKISPIL